MRWFGVEVSGGAVLSGRPLTCVVAGIRSLTPVEKWRPSSNFCSKRCSCRDRFASCRGRHLRGGLHICWSDACSRFDLLASWMNAAFYKWRLSRGALSMCYSNVGSQSHLVTSSVLMRRPFHFLLIEPLRGVPAAYFTESLSNILFRCKLLSPYYRFVCK